MPIIAAGLSAPASTGRPGCLCLHSPVRLGMTTNTLPAESYVIALEACPPPAGPNIFAVFGKAPPAVQSGPQSRAVRLQPLSQIVLASCLTEPIAPSISHPSKDLKTSLGASSTTQSKNSFEPLVFKSISTLRPQALQSWC